MSDEIGDLEQRMQRASQAMDFELASRLRDRINLIRGGASAEDAAMADTTGLTRQRNGAMGLGTGQTRPTLPAGWTPPRKPDPMTTNRSKRRG